MRYILLLFIPFLLNAQTNNFDEHISLEENEQMIIDVIIGDCFTASTNAKVIITKLENAYEFIYIKNITKTLLKIDEKLVLYRKKGKEWLKNNLQTLKKYGTKTILTEAQFHAKLQTLKTISKGFDGCKSRFAGMYSRIRINSKNINFKKSFSCTILMLDFFD